MLETKIKAAVDAVKSEATALAVDWIQLIGIIAEVLLPLLQNCFNKEDAAVRMSSPNFVQRARLRKALHDRLGDDRRLFGARRYSRELAESLVKVAQNSTPDELMQVYEEAVST